VVGASNEAFRPATVSQVLSDSMSTMNLAISKMNVKLTDGIL
jgi:hypothetical protein